MHSVVQDIVEGQSYLAFSTRGGEHETVLRAMGHEPTPYFWGSLLEYLAPDITEAVTFSVNDGLLEAYGSRDVVELLQEEVEPYLEDAHLLEELLDEAYDNGYEVMDRPGW